LENTDVMVLGCCFFFVFFKREPKIFQHVDIRTEVTHHRKIEYIYMYTLICTFKQNPFSI